MKLILQGVQTDYAIVERIARLADAQTITAIGEQAWRCEGVSHSAPVRALVDAACQHAQLDGSFIAAGAQLADYKLLVMDMDSTLITIECIDEIADLQGLKPQVAAITEAAMRGEIEFQESLTRRVALLKGLPASALEQVFDERLALSAGAEKLLAGVKAAGIKTVLVSGGFSYFTERLHQALHFDVSLANTLEIVDGKLTGRVLGEIIDAAVKRRTVLQVAQELGVPSTAAIVIGDGANDLQMMSVAGLSVAFRAKPVVREKANVALNVVGLDGVLNLFL